MCYNLFPLLVSIIAFINNIFGLFLWDKFPAWGFQHFFLPSNSHQEWNPNSVYRAVCGLAPFHLSDLITFHSFPLTLFQYAEHTLTSGPLHWLLPLFERLFPQMSCSLTPTKVLAQISPHHRGLSWAPWNSTDPHHHSLAFILLYLFHITFTSQPYHVCICLLPDGHY